MVHYLNSKYEDGLLELEELRVNRQSETNRVINNLKAKIEQFEVEIVSKNEEISNAAVKRRELEMVLEDAKAAGRSELQEVKMKFAKKEEELSVSYKTKIEKIVAEAEERLIKSASCFQEEAAVLQLSLNESLQRVHDMEVALSKAKEAHNSELNQTIRESDARYNSHVADQLSVRESLRGQHAKAIQDMIRTEREKAGFAEKHLQNTLVAETVKALAAERIRSDQVLRDSKQILLESVNQAEEEAERLASERDTIINKMYGMENEMVNLRREKQNSINLAATEKTRADAAEGRAMKLNDELTTRAKEVEELITRLNESRNEIKRVQLSLTASYNKTKVDFENEHSALKLELHACRCKAKEEESNLLMESRLVQERVEMEAEDVRSVAQKISERNFVIEGNLNQVLKTLHKTRTAAEEDAKLTTIKALQDEKTFTNTIAKLETERDKALFNASKAVSEMEEKQQFMLLKEQQKRFSISSELNEAQTTVTFLQKDRNRALIVAGLKAYTLCKAHKETSDSLLKEAEKTKELNGLLEAANVSIMEEKSLVEKCKAEANIREKDLRQQLVNEWFLKLEEQRNLHQRELKSNLMHTEKETKKLRNDMNSTISALTKELELSESSTTNTRKLHEKALLVAETDLDKAKTLLQHETELWSRERETLLSSVTKAQEKAKLDASCLREELQAAHSAALEKQSAIHLQAMDELRAERIESYERDISMIKQKLKYEKLLTFHRLETTQSELDAVCLETTLRSALMKQKLTAQCEKNRSLCEQLDRNETQKAIDLNKEQMRACDVEARLEREFVSFCDMKSTSKKEMENLKIQINILQAKYSRRPSREEDSLLIGHLEKEVSQKTAVLEKALEDMAYIKRELINREENYNKKFNSTPVVGTLKTWNGLSSQPSDKSVPALGRPPSRPFSQGRRRRSSQGK